MVQQVVLISPHRLARPGTALRDLMPDSGKGSGPVAGRSLLRVQNFLLIPCSTVQGNHI